MTRSNVRKYLVRGLLLAAITASFISASPSFAGVISIPGSGGGG